jgi:hypothetical protein
MKLQSNVIDCILTGIRLDIGNGVQRTAITEACAWRVFITKPDQARQTADGTWIEVYDGYQWSPVVEQTMRIWLRNENLSEDLLTVAPEPAPTSPVEAPEVEQAESWLNAWLDDDPAPVTDKIADLRTKWEQALANLEAVAAEHDLTLAGNLKFNMASKMAVIARDDLYYAETAASRVQTA